MGNEISAQIRLGTIGELLVQLRLLQYGVQAAAPLKDSGNDLIAVKGDSFRSIQIKTTAGGDFSFRRLPPRYHVLALVHLKGDGHEIALDASDIFLIPNYLVPIVAKNRNMLSKFRATQKLVDLLFEERNAPCSQHRKTPSLEPDKSMFAMGVKDTA